MFDIIEPKECSVLGFTMQIADRTRRKLTEMLPVVTESEEDFPIPTKEELKALRERGKTLFADSLVQLDGNNLNDYSKAALRRFTGSEVCTPEILQVLTLVGTINKAFRRTRKQTYMREGILSAAKAYAFTNGIKLNTKDKQDLVWALGWYPDRTSGETDLLGEWSSPGAGVGFLCRLNTENEGVFQYMGGRQTALEGSKSSMNGVCSTEGTDALFHGFLNRESVFQLRWQSMRLGAAVKQVTGDDDQARRAADNLRDVKSYTFKLYPNDYPFGEVYAAFGVAECCAGITSCMSGDEFSRIPYNLHPCDVYSSAHFGAGDNGLVLVVAYKRDTVVARGIMNVNTKQVVRWYGTHAAHVQFMKQCNVEAHYDALCGSWLALVQDDVKFVHPYIDGDYEYGKLDEGTGRITLHGSGEYDLQNTSGFTYYEETHECVYDAEYYPESEMTYQPVSDTYIYDDNIHRATKCTVTGEYFSSYNCRTLTIDGDWCDVWEDADMSDYTHLNNDIGYTMYTYAYTFDDVTEEYYTNEDYAELIAAREEEQDDEDSDAVAA